MISFTIHLDGRVHVLEMTRPLFLSRAQIEAAAEFLPAPVDLPMAHKHFRERCHQFELFDTLDEAEAWAARYIGFRENEVRAALRRFLTRRAERGFAAEINNPDCGQNHNERTPQYANHH